MTMKDKTSEILQELEGNLQILKELIGKVDSAIITSDTKNKITTWNSYAEELYQWKREEIIGKKLEKILVPEDLINEYNSKLKGLRASSRVEYDSKILRKDGSVIPAHIITTHLHDINGDNIGFIQVSYDISGRVKAEGDLRVSEEKYKELADLLPQIVFEIDNEGILTYANHEAFTIFGYSEKDFANGINILECVLPEGRKRIGEDIQYVILGKKIEDHEYTALKKDGTPFPVLIYVNSIKINEKTVGLRGVMVDISNSKNIEEELQHSVDRLNQIIENSHEWIWEVDNDGMYTYASNISKDILGYSIDEVVNKKYFFDFFHHDEREKLKKAAFAVFKQQKPFKNFINRNISKNGNEIWLSTSAVPKVDKAGNLVGYRGADVDITASKLAEEALMVSEKKYKNIYDNALFGMLRASLKEPRVVMVNRAAASLFGYSSTKEFIDNFTGLLNLVKNEDREKIVNELLERGSVEKVLLKSKKRDGTDIWNESSLSLSEDKQYVDCLFFEVTKRIKAEEQLRKSEIKTKVERDRCKQYLDIAEIVFVSLDKEGVVQLINPKGCKVLGYPKEEILGKSWFDNFLPEKIRENTKKVNLLVYTGEMESVKYHENEILTKSGEERIIAWHNSVLKDADGNITGTLSSGEDITERKKAEDELRKHQEHLEELVRERTLGLENKNKELDEMLKVFVGRELKINSLQEELRKIKQSH